MSSFCVRVISTNATGARARRVEIFHRCIRIENCEYFCGTNIDGHIGINVIVMNNLPCGKCLTLIPLSAHSFESRVSNFDAVCFIM